MSRNAAVGVAVAAKAGAQACAAPGRALVRARARGRPPALWCAVAAAAAAAAASVPGPAAAHLANRPDFRVYWNVPTFGCRRFGAPFNVSAWGVVQNAGDDFRGERLLILYDPGAFPALLPAAAEGKGEGEGEAEAEGGRWAARNGGVPQQGDLQRHLAALAADVQRLVPDADFAGVGVLDMESWRPLWRQLFGSFKRYKEYSRGVERRLHPAWRADRVEAEAQERFEAAAKAFMEASLELVRQLRPRALWGYYAYPYCFNARQSRGCPAQVQQENDRLQWLFAASGALFPSVYLASASASAPGGSAAFVGARVAEALRVAGAAPRLRGPAVFPYVRYNYYDTGAFLSAEELYASIATPKNLGVNGVIIWGSWNDVKSKAECEALQHYVGTVLGPIARNLTDISNNP